METIEFIKSFYGKTTVEKDSFLYDFRFPYLFSDPNSAAYFVLMAYGYFLHSFNSILKMYIVSLIVFCTVLVTQSNGAVGAFILMIAFFLISKFIKNFNFKYLIVSFFLIIIIFVGVKWLIEIRQEFVLIDTIYDRLFNSSERLDGGGGRFYHWKNLFSMYPLPFGRGHHLIVEGSIRFPHSDFLGLLYRYGFLALFFLLIFLLKHKRSNIYIYIPAIICMLINELIADQKLFGLFLVLIVINEKIQIKNYAKDIAN